jgi:hypothetical protein
MRHAHPLISLIFFHNLLTTSIAQRSEFADSVIEAAKQARDIVPLQQLAEHYQGIVSQAEVKLKASPLGLEGKWLSFTDLSRIGGYHLMSLQELTADRNVFPHRIIENESGDGDKITLLWVDYRNVSLVCKEDNLKEELDCSVKLNQAKRELGRLRKTMKDLEGLLATTPVTAQAPPEPTDSCSQGYLTLDQIATLSSYARSSLPRTLKEFEQESSEPLATMRLKEGNHPKAYLVTPKLAQRLGIAYPIVYQQPATAPAVADTATRATQTRDAQPFTRGGYMTAKQLKEALKNGKEGFSPNSLYWALEKYAKKYPNKPLEIIKINKKGTPYAYKVTRELAEHLGIPVPPSTAATQPQPLSGLERAVGGGAAPVLQDGQANPAGQRSEAPPPSQGPRLYHMPLQGGGRYVDVSPTTQYSAATIADWLHNIRPDCVTPPVVSAIMLENKWAGRDVSGAEAIPVLDKFNGIVLIYSKSTQLRISNSVGRDVSALAQYFQQGKAAEPYLHKMPGTTAEYFLERDYEKVVAAIRQEIGQKA